ncbi:MAG: bifunctional pyr operon transcriptional regulator/uracil phosphoribosyltransferase PyrR [Planctomycetes bacterium]|jgi:pyrimidine operon attenuation protein/uracil phosphoribosyltransferase|nr:bifunctional pyr operon transcriptional regulator/uracil phosphoribosyltransferase PyrR [Planctomycetota bacterium]MCL4731002.1 bifunctional pyr operon transcriptional regulator/uracil phosphoribosyltransferase PyrR [Planctomycetota bacterium]
MPETLLHGPDEIAAALADLAARLCADTPGPALVGVHTNGVPLAARLARLVAERTGNMPELGALDITLYRDDLAGRALPVVRGSEIPFSLEGRRVVLVDDVLFTGRTVRAALNVLADFGRPRRVQLCVLVDRGHRELPIAADYAGMIIRTEPADRIRVKLTETGAPRDEIVLAR